MAGSKGGGPTNMIKKVTLYLIGAGLLLALLKTFNYDPFGVINWIWDWIVKIVNRISDFFTGSKTFKEITKKPSLIVIPWR